VRKLNNCLIPTKEIMIPRLLCLENEEENIIKDWIMQRWRKGDNTYFWPPSKMSKHFDCYFEKIDERFCYFKVGKEIVKCTVRDMYCHAEKKENVKNNELGLVEGSNREEVNWREVYGSDYKVRLDCWLLSGIKETPQCETKLRKIGKLMKNWYNGNKDKELVKILNNMSKECKFNQMGKEMIEEELLKYGFDIEMFLNQEE
jgi:hypothetical protein